MTNAFRMSIGADRGAVAKVTAAFAEFADKHALPASVRRSVCVVLDELLTNTIVHGFAGLGDEGGVGAGGGGRGSGEATVEVELRRDRVSITLTDDGKPFDPFSTTARPPDSALPVEDRPIGGLGIHLVRRMMDEVSYQRRAGRNVVVLLKRLTGGNSLDITTRTQKDVTIVGFVGNLDSNTSPQAQQALESILASGCRKIVVDFVGVDYISSAGLRVLLGAAKRLRGPGGELRLFGLNETVREVFQISGFSTILAVFATEAEALKGL